MIPVKYGSNSPESTRHASSMSRDPSGTLEYER